MESRKRETRTTRMTLSDDKANPQPEKIENVQKTLSCSYKFYSTQDSRINEKTGREMKYHEYVPSAKIRFSTVFMKFITKCFKETKPSSCIKHLSQNSSFRKKVFKIWREGFRMRSFSSIRRQNTNKK